MRWTRLMTLAVLACTAIAASTVTAAGAAVLGTGGAQAVTLVPTCGIDEFEGPALDPRWTVLRRDDAQIAFAGGRLSLGMGTGDLITGTASAQNVITQEAPAGGWVATTTFNIAQIGTNGEQAGMALWGSEGTNNNTFAKAVFIQTGSGARQFEVVYTDKNELARPISASAAYAGPADADVSIRMRADGRRVVTEYSLDGTAWTQIGDVATFNGPLRTGLVAMRGGTAGAGGVVPYERFTLECGPDVAVTTSAASGEAPLAVDLTGTVSEAGATLAWDFGDGTTASGGLTQSHTYAAPGTYRAELRATGANGVATVGSTLVTVLADAPACPARSDEFAGNALDPKWEILRSVPTRLSVSDGSLRLSGLGGDMHAGTANARNVVLQTAPAGAWIATAKIDVSALATAPAGGQTGLLVWKTEGTNSNNFAKIVYNRRSATSYWIERQNNTNSSAAGGATPEVTGSPTFVYIRARSNGAANPTIRAEYSLDGQSWTAVQGGFQMGGGAAPIKVGVVYFHGGTTRSIAVDSFEFGGAENCGADTTAPTTQAILDPAPPAGNQFQGPVGVTLDAFDNVGGSGLAGSEYRVNGGDWTPYTGRFVISPNGSYTVDYRSTDVATNVETFKSVSFTIAACEPLSAPEAGFERLWNGTSTTGWRQAGPGSFSVVNDGPALGCRLQSQGGLGLFWYAKKRFDEFVLRLQWRTTDETDNSGVFVRFPHPNTNQNWPIAQGHEIQIREGEDTQEPQKTGSIYNLDREDARAARAIGEWNDYEIRYEDGTYTITLNGTVVNTWERTGAQGRNRGFIGLQNHGAGDSVSFRDIRVQDLTPPPAASILDTIGITDAANAGKGEIYGGATNYAFVAELLPPGGSVLAPDNDDDDDVPMRMPDTTGDAPNLASMNGQTLSLRAEDQKSYDKVHLFGAATDAGPQAGGTFTFTYSDGTSETANVQWRDWGNPGTESAGHHIAIGPMESRYTWGGPESPVPFHVYHVTVDLAQNKQLVSVRLPDGTATGVAMGYLMGLTLEEQGTGGFEMPNLTGEDAGSDDETAPATEHALEPGVPTGSGGWYLEGPVTVELTGVDVGSGVARTQYRVDGGPFQTYSAAFEIGDDGDHLVEYRSIDRAGNAEAIQSVNVKIDSTQPTANATVDPEEPTAGDWYDTAVELTLGGRDGSGSGVSTLEYRIGGPGAWRAALGPLTFGEPGTFDVEYRATDAAGNVSEAGTLTLQVDPEAPTTTASTAGDGPVVVTFARADNGSGVASTEYRVDGGAWTAYGAPFSVAGAGLHSVEYRSVDVAGNLENAKELTFTISSGAQGGGGDGGGAPAPVPAPFVAIRDVRERVGAAGLARGLKVSATCAGAEGGRASLTVSRAVARRLGLKGTTLAAKTVRCDEFGRLSVTLKTSGAVKRRLARMRGTARVTLTVRLAGGSAASTDRQQITLRGRK